MENGLSRVPLGKVVFIWQFELAASYIFRLANDVYGLALPHRYDWIDVRPV